MIAYDHYIRFVPEIHTADSAGLGRHIIAIREEHNEDPTDTLHHKLTFFNNQGRNVALYTDREFGATQKGQLWNFVVEDVVTFFWESGAKTVYYVPKKKFTNRLLEYWTLHILLPIFFTIEESYDFLHAGAVEVDEKPILFAAESFGGKSTLADFFIRQGHPLLSDDRVGCYEHHGRIWAIPSHPHHRPYRMMEELGYFVDNMAKEPRPIHAIYALVRSDAKADITISQLQGVEKFVSLRHSSDINIGFLKTKRFAFLSRLAQTVPLFSITVPRDKERLPEVYNTIVQHTNTLSKAYIE